LNYTRERLRLYSSQPRVGNFGRRATTAPAPAGPRRVRGRAKRLRWAAGASLAESPTRAISRGYAAGQGFETNNSSAVSRLGERAYWQAPRDTASTRRPPMPRAFAASLGVGRPSLR